MTVKVRKYKRGGWEVDIIVRLADGKTVRERKKAPVSSKSGAMRWGQERERALLMASQKAPKRKKEVPTLNKFARLYIEEHCEANRQKPSHIYNKQLNLKNNILPVLGSKRLDDIDNVCIEKVKARMRHMSSKTVNNNISTLSALLKAAVHLGVIDRMPCSEQMLKVPPPTFTFYDYEEYARFVEAAGEIEQRHLVMALLGGDAGLRRGEIMGLEWSDCDLKRGELTIERAQWRDEATAPKGNRFRRVPMTQRLRRALAAHRHLRGPRVLYRDDGRTVSAQVLHEWMKEVQGRAGLKVNEGSLHTLRHTFCSHLAMRGAPAKAIQELAGHADLSTTMRYMHLSPAVLNGAIKLLEVGHGAEFGDIMETEGKSLKI